MERGFNDRLSSPHPTSDPCVPSATKPIGSPALPSASVTSRGGSAAAGAEVAQLPTVNIQANGHLLENNLNDRAPQYNGDEEGNESHHLLSSIVGLTELSHSVPVPEHQIIASSIKDSMQQPTSYSSEGVSLPTAASFLGTSATTACGTSPKAQDHRPSLSQPISELSPSKGYHRFRRIE
ncbi:hypothetical protein DL93DRAFT_1860421 [Clavulina sp. PMI_390]|nr:hypothetical protein DL93DRAFT_1860421 [Clavulina sp. PMI_390]